LLAWELQSTGMTDAVKEGPTSTDTRPQHLFASLGFDFVHRFLWLVLGGCLLALAGGLSLGWALEGDVSIRAEGVIRPTSRHLVKSAIEGRVADILVHAGDRVEEEELLVVLSPLAIRAQLARVEAGLELSDARSARLRQQIEQDRLVLLAVLNSRRLGVERANFVLDHVRREQQVYTEHARADWVRADLEDLVPVRESASAVAQAKAELTITQRQLEANDARLGDLPLEQQSWLRLNSERSSLWAQLESTVIRAPVDGVVLTGDLDLRIGDRIQVGEALMELAEDNAWSARVLIQQIDRPRVKTGQRARVFIAAYPHLEYGVFEGKVTEIAEQAVVGAGYVVDVDLDEVSLSLADGMEAEVRVSVESGRLLQLLWLRLLRELGQTSVPSIRQARG
jgi:multidrug resistance efflux pump